MRRVSSFFLLAAACTSGGKPSGGGDSSGGDADTDADTDGDADVTCAEPTHSSCADPASLIEVVVRPGPAGPTTGDLVLYMTHLDLGQEKQGGYYHYSQTAKGTDFADGPVLMEIDMCDGGEMWSVEYGDYNLVAILDQDGNNQPAGFDSDRTPDEGEPSARVSPVTFTQGAESQCFDDIVLDCLDGKNCAAY